MRGSSKETDRGQAQAHALAISKSITPAGRVSTRTAIHGSRTVGLPTNLWLWRHVLAQFEPQGKPSRENGVSACYATERMAGSAVSLEPGLPQPPQTPIVRLHAEYPEADEQAAAAARSPASPLPLKVVQGLRSVSSAGDEPESPDGSYQLFRKSITALKSFAADDPDVIDKHALCSRSATMSMSGFSSAPMSPLSPLRFSSAPGSPMSPLKSSLQSESRPSKLIVKQYGQGLVYSMFIVAINIPLVYALSHIEWHVEEPAGSHPAFTLNRHTYQLSLIFQCIFPLSLYALILYACIKSTWKIPRALVAFVGVVCSLAVIVVCLFWHYDVPFWFYSGDFIFIALTYVPSMCAVGWFLAEEGATKRERFGDLMMIAVLETVVASASLLYCMYLMPLFFLLSAWVQLAWMCLLHPIYFELTTAIMLRMVLRRNSLQGRTGVQWFLSIVHASVHSITISCILTASIDSFGVTILTQVICSAVKLVWRSTTNLRDIWVERIGKRDWTFTYTVEEQAVQNRMIAVGILTEMVLENASNVLAPWLIWCTWRVPLFMSMAPSQLVEGGTYPAYYVILLILTLVVVTATFDLAFLFLNYHTWQQLPVIQTWREIRAAGWWYMGFLSYALTFMGIMFLFISMLLLPRAVFCKSDNYCDCKLPTLQGICDGEYISTWGGNII